MVVVVVLMMALPSLAAPHACGSQLLAQQRLTGRVASMPTRSGLPQAAARPTTQAQDPIAVGTELTFPVFGYASLVAATCRFAGEKVFIFVENRQWDTEGGSILQSHVDDLAQLFEQSTPADPQRGIYDLAIETFGAPPDVDGHEPIFLLIVDSPTPGLIGWFDANVADHAIPELRRDVIHLDELAIRRNSYLARGTLAHEFQHLIHWNWDEDEEAWIDEGLAGYAEELVGYPEADPVAVPAFLERPDTPLTEFPLFGAEARHYGSTYLYASYLAQRYGRGFITRLVSQERNGIFGVEAALGEMGVTADFESTWADWALANVTGGELGFAYDALDSRRAATFAVSSLPLNGANGQASRWGTSNILFRTPGDVAIDFDGDDAGRYRVWSVQQRNGSAQLTEIELDGANQGRSLNAAVDSVIFIVGRTSIGGGNYELDARSFVPTAILAGQASTPDAVHLGQAYPNPFNSTVQIPFELSDEASVSLEIVDVLGRRVWHRALPRLAAGSHLVRWDGTDDAGRGAATGVYRVRLLSAGDLQVESILLLR